MAAPGYPPTLGGVEQVVAQAARALARAGHEVEVFAQQRADGAERTATEIAEADAATADAALDELPDPPDLRHPAPLLANPAARAGRVIVHRFATYGPHDYPVSPGLWQAVAARADEFDVVHGHSYHTLSGLAGALGSRARAPFVFSPHYHGTGHSPLRAALHRIYRPVGGYVFHRADAVVCVSEAEARLVAQHFPAAADRCTVVPNGVDRAAIRAAQPFPGSRPTILSAGRLERYKRVDRLIEAFAEQTYPGVRLVVIGAGPDRERLVALARSHGLFDRGGPRVARFPGRVAEDVLYRWLRTCRVLCSLSEHEAFGLAPAEALVAGATAVLSDIPAHRELAASGPVELVPAAEGAAALAARLDRHLYQPLPSPDAVTVADWDDVAERLVAVYQSVASARRGTPRRPPGARR
ncbi:glycosyltransferase [Actinospica durhamensis]|uniref:Glycosyltransferase n=1 Tax=Actinospica durhamensis TaxID=1508375 RepID=A0A941ERT4_9ACTN|nr:glycosyltransferase [Actinospica durhamensis]MBR7836852.1 glycosyltransferase [Actinospica durhamensis]